MATSTGSSGSDGPKTSRRASSAAGGAAGSSAPASRGTSATTTTTPRATGAPNTATRTAPPKPTPRSANDAGPPPPAAGPAPGFIEAAVLADIGATKVPGAEGLTALAVALARRMDGGMSATAYSQCGKTLLDVLNRIRDLAPPTQETDGLDELSNRRATRLRGAGA